ncbi:MAG: Vibrio phage vB VpaM [Pseudomonadota bacterium]|jgi:site-specific DNA-methyltransferase (adenine-specific)
MQVREFKNATLYCGDCADVIPSLPTVDLVCTDPPYFRVKGDYWDNEWDQPRAFLDWMGSVVDMLTDRLASNGSLYLFASPAMAGRVEVEIMQRLHVLNHLVWRKGSPGMRSTSQGNKADKASLRAWWPESERIIFAEHYNSDNIARGESSYIRACDELRGFVFEPIRAYLDNERARAGVSAAEVNKATGTQTAGHWFTRVQWALPTERHYLTMRQLFTERLQAQDLTTDHAALRREYDDLATEYEALRGQYDDLKAEFESLRRPFDATGTPQWSDVWEFDPVPAYPGKHPCEKPMPLLAQVIVSSSRPGALVLDAFMGSGSTGHAALSLGRRFIGIERDPAIFEQACQRIAFCQAQSSLF